MAADPNDMDFLWKHAAQEVLFYLYDHQGQAVTREAILASHACSAAPETLDSILVDLKTRGLIELPNDTDIVLA